MLNHLKSLSKDSFAYSLSNVVTRASSFILLPIYARLFTPADVGTINLVNVTYFLVSSLSLLCLDSAAVVFFWKDEIPLKEKIFSTWFWFVCANNVLILAIVFFFSESISRIILGNGHLGNFFILMFLAGVFNVFSYIYTNYLRIKRQPFLQLKIAAVLALLNVLSTIFFLFYLKPGVIGIFYGQLASAIIGAVICFLLFKRNLLISFFDKQLLRDMLRFSLPIVPTTLAFWASSSIAVYVINVFYDKHEVGIYNVANSIASLINIVVAASSQAVMPFALSIQKDKNASKIYSNIFEIYFITIGCVAFLTAMFGKEILTFVATSKFSNGGLVLILMLFNSVMTGAVAFASIGLNIAQKMKSLLSASLISTIVNVVLVVLLVPSIGITGGGIASLTSSCLLVVLVMKSSQKSYFIPYKYSVPIVSFVIYLFVALVFFYIPGGLPTTLIAIKIAVSLLLILIPLSYVKRHLSLHKYHGQDTLHFE